MKSDLVLCVVIFCNLMQLTSESVTYITYQSVHVQCTHLTKNHECCAIISITIHVSCQNVLAVCRIFVFRVTLFVKELYQLPIQFWYYEVYRKPDETKTFLRINYQSIKEVLGQDVVCTFKKLVNYEFLLTATISTCIVFLNPFSF